jgi:hypothetical protein
VLVDGAPVDHERSLLQLRQHRFAGPAPEGAPEAEAGTDAPPSADGGGAQ